jgi:hypothetical protein
MKGIGRKAAMSTISNLPELDFINSLQTSTLIRMQQRTETIDTIKVNEKH